MKNVAGLVGVFLVLAFALKFWVWIVAVVTAVAVLAGAVWVWASVGVPLWERRQHRVLDRRNGETARRSGLAARAEFQHQQYLAGEDRGVYGEFPPVVLD